MAPPPPAQLLVLMGPLNGVQWGVTWRLLEPQVAHLGAKVGSISDVGEEEFRVTGSAGRDEGAVLHLVVVDIFR